MDTVLTMVIGWVVINAIILAGLIGWKTFEVIRSGEVKRQRMSAERTGIRLERLAYEDRKRAAQRQLMEKKGWRQVH